MGWLLATLGFWAWHKTNSLNYKLKSPLIIESFPFKIKINFPYNVIIKLYPSINKIPTYIIPKRFLGFIILLKFLINKLISLSSIISISIFLNLILINPFIQSLMQGGNSSPYATRLTHSSTLFCISSLLAFISFSPYQFLMNS